MHGQNVGNGGGVGHVTGNGVFHERDLWQWRHVDERQSEPGGRVRHALGPKRFDEHSVKARGRRLWPVLLQQFPHLVAAVYQVALQPTHFYKIVVHPERVAEVVQEPDQVHVQAHRKPFGYVHFRVIVSVTFQERRERGNRMPVVHQGFDNATHEVPVAPAAHRLDGQYPRASCGNRTRPPGQREDHKDQRHSGAHRPNYIIVRGPTTAISG